MASGKEIRTKIASVKSTQKITKAMEMVAASKLRRTQQRMAASRPYAERIKTVIGHLSEANPDYRHPYLVTRDVKRVGYIVISTDRGLCGGLNVNTFRTVINDLRKWQSRPPRHPGAAHQARGQPDESERADEPHQDQEVVLTAVLDELIVPELRDERGRGGSHRPPTLSRDSISA